MRLRNRAIDAISPTSIATVRSNTTVRRKVMIRTAKSAFGFLASILIVRQPLMLYDTIISTAARQGIGISPTRRPKRRRMRRSTMAWMMPATGVLPPLLMFVMVLAIAPVAGMPPKSGLARFATP